MTLTTSNYLDLKGFLISEVIGDPLLAYFIGLIIIIIFAININADWKETMGIVAVYTFIVMSIMYNLLIAGAIILAIAAVTYAVYTKWGQR